MKTVRLSHPTKILNGTIHLPASKSISNRALILKYVLNSTIELHNLSLADDTLIMQQALQQGKGTMNIKNAGTCMRFLTAYYAAKPGYEVILLCDERMEKRPIAELVNILTQLGADITYLHNEGFPPLQIKGKQLNGGTIYIAASASSQFVSALMMIAPLCKTKLTIEITGTITSQPYIEMTAQMMHTFGIQNIEYRISNIENSTIHIPSSNTELQTSNFNSKIVIEPDWSAASYWYELVALSNEAEIILPNLILNSIQGDCIVADYMKQFGVETIETVDGVVLKKNMGVSNNKSQTINLTNYPDLAPTLAVTAVATNSPVVLAGLQNLIIKESNRLQGITNELTKLGLDITATENSLVIHFNPTISNTKHQTSSISTYGDHRMAMAFAPLALVYNEIVIENPDVVEKSYPHFWDDLKLVGFECVIYES